MDKSRDKLSPSCSSLEELVEYLYDEMNVREKLVFETHLADCDVCTAEFAEVSFARLDVYEWHRDEFVELATPRIVIPYGEAGKVGLIEAIRAFFASPVGWATAGGSFAAVAIAAGIWFMSLGNVEVSKSEADLPVVTVNDTRPESRPQPVAELEDDSDNFPEPELPLTTRVKAEAKPEIVRTPAKKDVKSNSRPIKTRDEPKQPVQARRNVAAPRLNDFEDEDDTTLRLGDLLADVDTRD